MSRSKPSAHPGNEPSSPVPDEVLKAIMHATPAEAMTISRLLPERQRAQLALFCYERVHLRDTGCAIAVACDTSELVRVGGMAGEALVVQRRLPSPAASTRRVSLAAC
jgi:hypothetical protein